ncbi:MAG TPA: diguanylate cyclase, partial [Burkholderiaceae bacterium]
DMDDAALARYVAAIKAPASAHGLQLIRPGSAAYAALPQPQGSRALERARDRGYVLLSERLDAKQGPDRLLVLPVFADAADSVEARREQLRAWVVVPVNMAERLNAALGQLPPGLRLALYSPAAPLPGPPLFQAGSPGSAAPLLASSDQLNYSGRELTLLLSADATFAAEFAGAGTLWVLLGGLLLSAALTLLCWQHGRASLRAHALAAQMTQALSESEQRWAYALEGAGDGVWDWRVDTDRVASSLRWRLMMGLPAADVEPLMASLPSRAHPDDQERLSAELQRCRDGLDTSLTSEYRIGDGKGGWLWVLMRGTVVAHGKDGQPKRMIGTLSDIHARRVSEERVRFMALHDPLTELANRAHFDERMHFALANARRYQESIGLILLDLDRFKPVNDQHGHAVGDQLLQTVARRIKSSVRETDTVGRIGGDEFVVLLTGPVTRESAQHVAAKIYTQLAQPMELAGLHLEITCSVGLALYPEDGNDELTLAKAADDAMYRNKRAGRRLLSGEPAAPPANDGFRSTRS